MDTDITFSFEVDGNKYALIFSEYHPNSDIDIPVIEISLSLDKYIERINSLKVFSYIISKIEKYIAEREVILYYYCDSAGIYYRNNNKRRFQSPQHFRSELFQALFLRVNSKTLFIKNSVVSNPLVGNHYISFIYKQKHQPYVDTLTKELEEYQK